MFHVLKNLHYDSIEKIGIANAFVISPRVEMQLKRFA